MLFNKGDFIEIIYGISCIEPAEGSFFLEI